MFRTVLRSIAIRRVTLALWASACLISAPQAQAPSTQAQSNAVNNPNGPTPAAIQGAGAASVGSTGMDSKSMMKAMNDKLSAMQMTGKQDSDFAMMMRAHHQSGIDMAQAELRDGKDPAMRKLAKGIIAAQQKEIAQMDAYLGKQVGSSRVGSSQ